MSGTTLSTLQTDSFSICTNRSPKVQALLLSPFHRWRHWRRKRCSNCCKVMCCNESCLGTHPPGPAALTRSSALGELPHLPWRHTPQLQCHPASRDNWWLSVPGRRHKAWLSPFLHSTMHVLTGVHFFKLFTWRQWRWDGWAASPMQWTWTWANSGLLRPISRKESDTTGWQNSNGDFSCSCSKESKERLHRLPWASPKGHTVTPTQSLPSQGPLLLPLQPHPLSSSPLAPPPKPWRPPTCFLFL